MERMPNFLLRPLPAALESLATLALDLRWTWSHAGDALWRRVNPEVWDRTQNPWVTLQESSQRRLDHVAQDPTFQDDLQRLRHLIREQLAGHDVLEIACGTGYWTEVISQTAKSVLATDINEEVLEIARCKHYPDRKVSLVRQSAYHLDQLNGHRFTAGLAVFWWSHLGKDELRNFLQSFHRALLPGALVVFVDNRFVPGSSTPISRTDADGNTYQSRRLADGDEFEVLKNFPAQSEAEAVLSGLATGVRWSELRYYWILTYRTALGA